LKPFLFLFPHNLAELMKWVQAMIDAKKSGTCPQQLIRSDAALLSQCWNPFVQRKWSRAIPKSISGYQETLQQS
jgi:hypothetical protein